MARYDYRCIECRRIVEVVHGMTENPAVICSVCGGDMRRKPTVPRAIAFNATEVLVGWMDENYKRWRAGKPLLSPDHVKRVEGVPGRDYNTR